MQALASDPKLDTCAFMQQKGWLDVQHVNYLRQEATGHILQTAGNMFSIFFTDITERRTTEDIRNRLVALTEETTDLVAFTDAAGSILHLNPAGYQALAEAVDLGLFRVRPDGTALLAGGDREIGEP